MGLLPTLGRRGSRNDSLGEGRWNLIGMVVTVMMMVMVMAKMMMVTVMVLMVIKRDFQSFTGGAACPWRSMTHPTSGNTITGANNITSVFSVTEQ